MLLRIFISMNLAVLLSAAVVVDRIAIIVGNRVVKTSDIDRDLRISQFMNREPLRVDEAERRKVAERLIDQELIRQELMNGGYGQPTEQDVNVFLQQMQRDRFRGSEPQLRAELSKFALTDAQLRAYLLWQLTVLRFIDQRFRAGVLVTDQDVKAYYDEHKTELQKAHPGNGSLEALDATIREILVGERINEAFDEWLKQTRAKTRIEYRDAAFQQSTGTEP